MAEELPSGAQPEKSKMPEAATAMHFREGARHVEVLERSVDKKQLIDASRAYMSLFENMSLNPDGTVAEWSVDQTTAIVESRISVMENTLEDLQDLGYLHYVNIDDELGKRTEAVFTFSGYAYSTTVAPSLTRRIEQVGSEVKHIVEIGEKIAYEPGTDDQRKELAKDLVGVNGEMSVRKDLVKMARHVWGHAEDLEGLTQFYFLGSPTDEAMSITCNAEGRSKTNEVGERVSFLKQTEGGTEYRKGHEFGDAMGVSMQCIEIAALSEKPKELEALLKRPGIKFLFNVTDQAIDDIFLEPYQRLNRPLDPILVKWIGEPWKWSQTIGEPKENVGNEQDSRGLLTRRGNILAESNWNDALDVFAQIDTFIGGGENAKNLAKKDANDARRVAWEIFKVTAMASDLGDQTYLFKEDKILGRSEGYYPCHEMGGMQNCDRVKVLKPNVFTSIYRYLKQTTQGFGPDGSFGKYPDRFSVPYFKTWNAKVTSGWSKDGQNHGKRTFDELRWGYRPGDLGDALSEPAYRLGELPWKKAGPKLFNGAALGIFIAGRKDIGLYQYMMNTGWDIRELKEKTFFQKLSANLRLSLNEQTVYNGRFRGVYNGETNDSKTGHDDIAASTVKEAIRQYRKQYVLAFWDGIRSLPQYQEWCGMNKDEYDTKPTEAPRKWNGLHPIYKMITRIGRMGILTRDELKKLRSDAYYSNKEETTVA